MFTHKDFIFILQMDSYNNMVFCSLTTSRIFMITFSFHHCVPSCPMSSWEAKIKSQSQITKKKILCPVKVFIVNSNGIQKNTGIPGK